MSDFYVLLKELWVVWFLILFLGIVVWVYWPGRKQDMQEHGNIPFRDDESRQQRK